MAGVYGLKGHQVTLCKLGATLHQPNFERIAATNRIEVRGIEGEGVVTLRRVTRDPGEALDGAEVVLVFYVSNFHEEVARRLAPHLRDGQLVVLGPGYAGSLLFEAACARVGNTSDVLYAELETLPHSCRIVEPGVIEICSKNYRHPLATFPASRVQSAVDRLTPVLGECVAKSNILEVALHNPNLSIHTAGTIMSAAHIEQSGDSFAMYKHAFSESIWKIVNKIDAEKMAVMERVGGKPTPYFEEFVLRTFEDLTTDPMKGFEHYANEAPKGPNTIQTRYLTEDVPMGLGLLSSLGRCAGIPTPMSDSFIHLACAIHDRDYWAEARTVEKLWPGSLDELVDYVQHGK